jgi:3-dehydroquinate synthase
MYSPINIKSNISNYEVRFISSLDLVLLLSNTPNTITFIDSNVLTLHPELQETNPVIIECTEHTKEFSNIGIILSVLSQKKANIKTKLVVIGGGVLQDAVGFCASIYCRGIEYILVPTTLLSQADSCIGGKTSINHRERKNILGTFYPPKDILIYPGFIDTLTPMDYVSGWGEIYKFHILQGKIKELYSGDLMTRIYDSLKYKASILAVDEFDKAERKWLNYGHTFGHALESLSEYKIPHGIGVILGCMVASRIAHKIQYTVNDYELILSTGIDLIKRSGITLDMSWFDADRLLEIVKSDKKSTGQLTMVLVSDKPTLVNINNINIVKESLIEVYESI